MTPTSLIIVADRGSLKAYKVNETPNRGASLQLVQAFDITDAHGRYDDKLTDQAGRFPGERRQRRGMQIPLPNALRSRPKTIGASANSSPNKSPKS